MLAHIARLNHFPQARNLQETIWKQLGAIMSALGKRVRPMVCVCTTAMEASMKIRHMRVADNAADLCHMCGWSAFRRHQAMHGSADDQGWVCQ